jgi:hypothetical protein
VNFKIETQSHIISVNEGYIVIEDKENEEETPIIREIDKLDTLYRASINSLHPIIDWLIKELKNGTRRSSIK